MQAATSPRLVLPRASSKMKSANPRNKTSSTNPTAVFSTIHDNMVALVKFHDDESKPPRLASRKMDRGKNPVHQNRFLVAFRRVMPALLPQPQRIRKARIIAPSTNLSRLPVAPAKDGATHADTRASPATRTNMAAPAASSTSLKDRWRFDGCWQRVESA